jgi:hypothetical protein
MVCDPTLTTAHWKWKNWFKICGKAGLKFVFSNLCFQIQVVVVCVGGAGGGRCDVRADHLRVRGHGGALQVEFSLPIA